MSGCGCESSLKYNFTFQLSPNSKSEARKIFLIFQIFFSFFLFKSSFFLSVNISSTHSNGRHGKKNREAHYQSSFYSLFIPLFFPPNASLTHFAPSISFFSYQLDLGSCQTTIDGWRERTLNALKVHLQFAPFHSNNKHRDQNKIKLNDSRAFLVILSLSLSSYNNSLYHHFMCVCVFVCIVCENGGIFTFH